MNLEVS